MPKILEDAVKQIYAKGGTLSSAYAKATSSLQKAGDLKPGTNKATPQGAARGQMTRAQRHANPPKK